MLQMMARESDVSQTILEFARLQRNYHTAALAILDEIIPEIELAIGKSSMNVIEMLLAKIDIDFVN